MYILMCLWVCTFVTKEKKQKYAFETEGMCVCVYLHVCKGYERKIVEEKVAYLF